MPHEFAIEFRNVSYRLDGSRELLHGLSFGVQRGETLVLLGKSGSGKTSSLTLINNLASPSQGDVLVDGRSTREWDVIRLRRMIAYVIQEVWLCPHVRAERNVALLPKS